MAENGYATGVDRERDDDDAGDNNPNDALAPNIASHFQALPEWDDLSPLDMALEQTQVHRPAIAGDAIVVVRVRPTGMMKAHVRIALTFIEHKPHASASPIGVRACDLDLELAIGH